MNKLLISLTILLGSYSGLAKESQNLPQSKEERVLIAYLKVKPGTEEAFLKSSIEVISETHKEAGNLAYVLHQSTKDPSQFMFYELFKTDADLQYHRYSKHVLGFLKEVEPILIPGQFTLEEYKID